LDLYKLSSDIYKLSITYYVLPSTPERETNRFYPTPRSFLSTSRNGLPFCMECCNGLAIYCACIRSAVSFVRSVSARCGRVSADVYVYRIEVRHAIQASVASREACIASVPRPTEPIRTVFDNITVTN